MAHWDNIRTGLRGRRRAPAGVRFVLFQDTSMSVLGSLLSILLVRWLSEPIPGFTRLVAVWLAVALAGTLAGLLLTGSAKAVRRYASVHTLTRLLGAALVKESVLALSLVVSLVHLPSAALGCTALAVDLLATAVFLAFPRYVASELRRAERTSVAVRASRRSALVVGTGPASVSLAEEAERTGGVCVAGFITPDGTMAGRVVADRVVYHCATPEDLAQLQWRLGGVDCILFPQDGAPDGDGTPASRAEDIPQADGMGRAEHALKRAFDASLSALLLVAFSPLMALCALAVRKEDGGPAIYAQERIGRGGRPFLIYKFRSMRTDAESAGPELYGGDADTRLTRVGRFLRVHHLDELPQLWNVLKGDMSFIGYRPERRCYIDRIMERNPRYRYLYQIRPGVTSYATLYNGYTDTMEKMLTRLDLDLYYLRNHSVGFDVRILGLTFLGIVGGRRF